jgi:hypothetical protein
MGKMIILGYGKEEEGMSRGNYCLKLPLITSYTNYMGAPRPSNGKEKSPLFYESVHN